MLPNVSIWLICVLSTGLVPGLVIAIIARHYRWSEKRLQWSAFLSAPAVWLLCGMVVEFAFHDNPWGWMAPWAATLLAEFTWLAGAELLALVTARMFARMAIA